MTSQVLKRWETYFLHCFLLIFIGVAVVGCAVKPIPYNDVYIQAIEGNPNTNIDTETGAARIQQNGIAVTIEPLDEVEIFSLTENPQINPFIFVGKRGNVEPIYTVFELTVHNLESSRVLVEESAILIDKDGAQYANLPYAYFEDLYDNVNRSGNNILPSTTYPHYQSHYPYYHTYMDIESLEHGQEVVAESLFESAKLFKGAKRRGLIIFDRLNLDTTDMRITVPGVRIVHSDGKEELLKFNFDFRQIVAEQ